MNKGVGKIFSCFMAMIIVASAVFMAVGCNNQEENRPLNENLDFYQEWTTVDSDYYDQVVGSANDDGLWVATPQDLATVGYLDEPMAMEKGISVDEGFYTFSAVCSIDNNQYPNAVNMMENDMILQLRVIKSDDGRIIAAQEIYRNDFASANTLEPMSVTFAIPYTVQVDLEVKYLNNATISMQKMTLQGVKAEDYTRTDYEGYFAETEADTKVTFDANNLYYFDLYDYLLPVRDSRWAYDVTLLISTLQGLVNRDANLLFIRFNGPNDHMTNQDGFWLEYLQQDGQILAGKPVVEVDTPAAILRLFADYFEGLVVWDSDVPATSNVACTVCGVDSLLPVRFLSEAGSVYDILTNDLHVAIGKNLVGMFKNGEEGNIAETNIPSTLSAKNDAYLWAKAKYMDTGKTSATIMANHLDAFSWDKSGKTMTYYNIQQQTLANKDYYIANKAFFWDLMVWEDLAPNDDPDQVPGTDFNTLKQIMTKQNELAGGQLTVLGGFIPWWIKYTDKAGEDMPADVQSEWKWASELGTYYAVKDADAYGYTSLANASIYCKVEQPEGGYQQIQDNSDAAVESRARQYLNADGTVKPNNYVMIYMGDYDASAWQVMAMPGIFSDPNLGKIPLSWPINPAPLNRTPMIANFMYENQVSNVYFIGDHNGYGYLELQTLDSDSRDPNLYGTLESYMQVSQEAWDFYDLDFQGLLINTVSTPYSERITKMMSDLAPAGVITNSQEYANGAIVQNSSGENVVWSSEIDFPSGSSVDVANTLVNYFSVPLSANFNCFRCILKTPTFVCEVVERMQAQAPQYNITVVDPYVYMYLMEIELG